MNLLGEKVKLLIAEPKDFSQAAINLLCDFCDVTCQEIRQQEISQSLTEYDVLWIRLGLTVRVKDIPANVRCRFIISATTGLNHLDLEALNTAGIEVLSLKGQTEFLSTITATAEHTIGLLLSLVRRIPAAHESVLRGEWDRDLFKGYELSGKTIGIIGFGRLGRILGSYCHAFRMEVIAFDPFVEISDPAVRVVESLEEIFGMADILSLHIPFNAETQGLVDRNLIRRMRPESYLINTSRGEIIVEQDLLEALENNGISGAALDVICQEEFFTEQNPLVQYAKNNNNLILTPHIGGCTWDSMGKCELFVAGLFRKTIAAQ